MNSNPYGMLSGNGGTFIVSTAPTEPPEAIEKAKKIREE